MRFDQDNIILLDFEHETYPMDRFTYVCGDYFLVELEGTVDRYYPVYVIPQRIDITESTIYPDRKIRYFTEKAERYITHLYFTEMKAAIAFIESRMLYEL